MGVKKKSGIGEAGGRHESNVRNGRQSGVISRTTRCRCCHWILTNATKMAGMEVLVIKTE